MNHDLTGTRCTRLASVPFLFFFAISALSAAPTITNVANAASNTDPRMPDGGIAQGAIFVVYGTGLGPANIVVAPTAFQSTTLSNTAVAVTVGGTTVNAPMYYTSASQVAALLPSKTPTGAGTITVTYSGQISAKAPITVVASNLGILTIDSSGSGPAILTYPDFSLVSPSRAANCGGPNTTCGAANPGDILTLWGTGLGPVNGDDASGAGLGVNMPNIPATVWVGGVQAPVTYQGRSGCCAGLDQVVFTVPNAVPTGCAVPLVVQINDQVSNTAAIPVANGSRTCASLSIPTLDVSQIPTASSFTLGDAELRHFLNDTGNGFVDSFHGFFARFAGLPPLTQAFLMSYLDNRPIGVCAVIGAQDPGSALINNLVNNGYVTLADGGSSVVINGPNGSANSQITGHGVTISNSGSFLVSGNYTVSGNGGKDIGPFTAQITIPGTPTLTSPSSAAGLTITRSKGLTVTWNPNGSTGHVEVVISVFVDQNTAAQAVCSAPASTGTLTVPPYILLALPATNGAAFYFQPGEQQPAFSGAFSASGLTVGIADSYVGAVAFPAVTLN
ncbi:MAG TPA: hypothetical protein VKT49_05370 [Bryobacteraceae bacterium]|nr:hypothetical protein [Bryobacteraceae bacterium]